MCRAGADGGRRCPGCAGETARAKHNERRRRNRELRGEIAQRAAELGHPSDVVRWLREGPPARAKEWAKEQGLAQHLHPGGGHGEMVAEVEQGQEQAVPAAGGSAGGVGAGLGGRARRGGARGVVGGVRGRPRARGASARAGAPERPASAGGDAPGWSQGTDWCTGQLLSQIQTGQSRQGQDRDERHLLSGEPRHPTRARGGTNETTRWQLDNGQVAFHKPFADLNDSIAAGFGQSSAQQSVHEVAAWRLAERLGEPYRSLVPPCVLREVEGKMGSFALERPGVPGAALRDLDDGERRAAAFFDCLIGQQDRHRGNYLVAGDRLTLIDHGYAFAKPGQYCNFSDFLAWRGGEGERTGQLSGAEIDALDQVLDSEDAGGLRGLIEDDRLEALLGRARRMRQSGRILGRGDY